MASLEEFQIKDKKMEPFSVTTTLKINPEQIRLDKPKAAKYLGIKAQKDTRILDNHGKLVSKWGRSIRYFLGTIFTNKENSDTKKAIYDFQKGMTKRRVEILMKKVQEDQEGKNRSNHVDS
ncbi:hypothetical protein, partial [Endozoicomonas sp. SESOKO1]|uniref:hypothetical protein n=1 Tax=Endozoicomonas sp. SESOKO1 TaxID=2828742 RepID=UPI002147334E